MYKYTLNQKILSTVAPAWLNPLETKITRKRGRVAFSAASFAIPANPLWARFPPTSEGSQTSSAAESCGAPLDGTKHQRPVESVGSTGGLVEDEAHPEGGDRGKGLALPDPASHSQSRRGGEASLDFDMWGFVDSDGEDVTSPSTGGTQGPGETLLLFQFISCRSDVPGS